MSVLSEVFERCRADNRAALIGYYPAGYPTVEGSIEAVQTMVAGGCDIIEVGIPYSDPMMDGPTIQAAADVALEAGFRIRDTFAVVRAVAEAGAVPVVMSYWNPILQYGVERFAADLAAAGGTGVITPDLIPDEAEDWIAATDAHGIDRVFLVAPSSTPERLAMTLSHTSGFVYIQAVMGVTGARDVVSDAPRTLTARVREHSGLACGVGLGVRNGDQAAEIASYADGVIVGSALITAATEGGGALARLTAELAAGVRRPGAGS
ncbi:MAG: tryptophan synthase subunit alpha [Dietzia sp.]